MKDTVCSEISDSLTELQDVIDECSTLSRYSDTPDYSQLNLLKDSYESTYGVFSKIHSLLSNQSELSELTVRKFNLLVDRYMALVHSTPSLPNINLDDYTLPNDFKLIAKAPRAPQPTLGPTREETSNTKSVRFKTKIVEASPVKSFEPYRDIVEDAATKNKETDQHNDPQKMAKPYRDSLFEIANGGDENGMEIDNPPIDLSNRQIFIHNQQQFDQQDEQLGKLHHSVRQQREMSLHINSEISDQFVLLNDLENNIESSNHRMIRSTGKLQRYREALKKRTDWMCIIILVFILLFLLIVVK